MARPRADAEEKKAPKADLPDTPSGAALAAVGEPDADADPHDEKEQKRASEYERLKKKARWG